MCVILHALKKKHVTKEEILQAMKANDAGFFMAALKPDGGRETIRTLSQEDAVKFFDKEVGDDDAFVMHARIPSRGTKTLDNVHGWEQDGVFFCHNMTLSDLDDVMDEEKWKGTDSEFFFRKVFMPFYKALGKDAYKDGKFAEPLDRLVRIAVQRSNKFLFIMPDNGVLRYGNWVNEADRKEGGEIAFWASNQSYKVYKRSWDTKPSRYGYGGYYGGYDGYDEGDGAEPWWKGTSYGAKAAKAAVEYDGTTLADIMGLAYLARTGFKTFVLTQALVLRGLAEAEFKRRREVGDEVDRLDASLGLRVFGDHNGREDDDLYEACDPTAVDGMGEGDVKVGSQKHISAYLVKWAAELERFLETRRGKYTDLCVHLTKSLIQELAAKYEDTLDAVLAALNCCVDLDATSLDEALTMYIPGTTRGSKYAMVRAKTVDLVVPTACDDETALSTATALLETTQELQLAEEAGEPGEEKKPAEAGGKGK